MAPSTSPRTTARHQLSGFTDVTDEGRSHHFELGAHTVELMKAASSAGQMHAEMADHADRTPVNLADPHELKAHLMSAHGWEHSDFHRNSQPPEVKHIIGPEPYDDRPLHPHEIRKLHDHFDHVAYRSDHPNATTLGDSHFHEA